MAALTAILAPFKKKILENQQSHQGCCSCRSWIQGQLSLWGHRCMCACSCPCGLSTPHPCQWRPLLCRCSRRGSQASMRAKQATNCWMLRSPSVSRSLRRMQAMAHQLQAHDPGGGILVTVSLELVLRTILNMMRRQDLESACKCTATVLKAERYMMRVHVASFDIDRSYHTCCGFGRYGSNGLVLIRDPVSVLQWHATRSAACAGGQRVHGGLPNAADGCVQAQWRPSELWPAAEGRLIMQGDLSSTLGASVVCWTR